MILGSFGLIRKDSYLLALHIMKRYQLFSLLGVFSILSFQTVPADLPNIVVIMADDIGLGDIGYYH